MKVKKLGRLKQPYWKNQRAGFSSETREASPFLLAMAMGRKNLFNDFINGNPKLILTGQNYGIYLRCRRFLTILLANTQTVLLEEPGGWFPNISSSEASPFFVLTKVR